MIQFSDEIGFWSKFTFWFVFINAWITLVFLVVVAIGGIFDLRYLFRALRSEVIDETDDGRVLSPPSETASPSGARPAQPADLRVATSAEDRPH